MLRAPRRRRRPRGPGHNPPPPLVPGGPLAPPAPEAVGPPGAERSRRVAAAYRRLGFGAGEASSVGDNGFGVRSPRTFSKALAGPVRAMNRILGAADGAATSSRGGGQDSAIVDCG